MYSCSLRYTRITLYSTRHSQRANGVSQAAGSARRGSALGLSIPALSLTPPAAQRVSAYLWLLMYKFMFMLSQAYAMAVNGVSTSLTSSCSEGICLPLAAKEVGDDLLSLLRRGRCDQAGQLVRLRDRQAVWAFERRAD